MDSEGSPNATNVQATEKDHPLDDFDSEDKEEGSWPKGIVYPLNSKKIVMEQLRRLVRILDVSLDGSLDTLRQLIEGKLIQLDREPRNTQVVVSSEDARLYLVDDSGIISEECEHVSRENFNSTHTAHETPNKSRTPTPELINESTDVEVLRTALHKARLEIEGLRAAMNERDVTLTGLRAELESVREELVASSSATQALRTEMGTLKQSLKSQTAKAKQFWAQKCEQLLAHEAELEDKDAIISNLQEQLANRRKHHPDALQDQGADLIQTQSPDTSLLSEVV